MTPAERSEYNRAYRLANKERLASYVPKQRLAAKARYLRDGDKLRAKANAYNAAHREECRARSVVSNAVAGVRSAARVATMKRMFELLPEAEREEYAHWLLLISDHDTSYGSAMRTPSFDYGYIAPYSGF